MTKPKTFIGSSRENEAIANALQQELDYASDAEIWTQGAFEPSRYPLESLEEMLDRADFAVFVFSPDDVTLMRGQEHNTVRDNVVFELGMFIGRLGRKRAFIVVPRDVTVTLPSDLAGLTPLHYESGRSSLRAALGSAATSIKEAIRTLSFTNKAHAEVAVQEPGKLDSSNSSDAGIKVPDHSWSLTEYSHAHFVAVCLKGDNETAARLDESFRASVVNRSPEILAEWESDRDWHFVISDQRRALKDFRDRAERFPGNTKLRLRVAQVLEHYGSPQEAFQVLKGALENAEDPDVIVSAIYGAVRTVDEESRHGLAEVMANLLDRIPNPSVEVLAAVRGWAETEGFSQVAIAIDEVLLQQAPDNVHKRFSVAFEHSAEGREALSLLHYTAIPTGERTSITWNNLGVAYVNLGMPGKGVEAYSEAASKGETLAKANLAQLLIQAGFFKKARELLQEAVASPAHHENVVTALSTLNSAKDAEVNTISEIRKQALEQQAYHLDIGKAALTRPKHELSENWIADNGEITIKNVSRVGYEGQGIFASSRKEKVSLTYHLKRIGNVLEGTWSQRGSDADTSIISSLLNAGKFLAIVSEDGTEIRLLPSTEHGKVSVWKSVNPALSGPQQQNL